MQERLWYAQDNPSYSRLSELDRRQRVEQLSQLLRVYGPSDPIYDHLYHELVTLQNQAGSSSTAR
jgi:murein L,D-transpeptidase YcbB/YkuD